MPNTNWSKLSHLQLGRYAEYYAKMEFASYGYDVYTSEVDDHGVDFVARNPADGQYYEIQVKSIRNWGYVFVPKDKMEISSTRLVFLLRFTDGNLPDCYVVPSTAWAAPNALLVDRNYEKPGQISKPEWGINFSKKNLLLLEPYREELYFHSAKLR
ncbi:hypothetical protein B5F98_00345 [Pseudoflavonifractor sp. An44]|uniref:hypothetical protein n=1 Tax=Pseudoflavonifractor sp. An44 TaxID=1965635 RepID=UPI000B38DFED|nr:hypothetical protein [Pseudoflavonifractor sp. An44]OUN99665.1 hypothetical protein B5F98_00345 [Pseudoflavonifractor sp. An44]